MELFGSGHSVALRNDGYRGKGDTQENYLPPTGRGS